MANPHIAEALDRHRALVLPGLADHAAESTQAPPQDAELITKFWSWYCDQRIETWARWRPNFDVQRLPLSAKRRPKLLARIREYAKAGASLSEQLDVARKVVRVIVAEIDELRARVVPSSKRPKGWDPMKQLEPEHWLRPENFERYLAKPTPRGESKPAASEDEWWMRSTDPMKPSASERLSRGG